MRSLVILIFAITLSGCSGMMLSGGASSGGVSAGGVSTAGSSGGTSAGSASSTPPSDVAISSMVREALISDSRLGRAQISVSTRSGVVQLSGSVNDYDSREAAEKLAMKVDGVRAVDNRLTVGY